MKFITVLLLFLSGTLLTSIITFSILLSIDKTKLLDCNDKLNILIDKNLSDMHIFNATNFLFFNNKNINNNFNLFDKFNKSITLSAKNIQNCIDICNGISKCHAFSKYNNTCHFKTNRSSNNIYPIFNIELYIKY